MFSLSGTCALVTGASRGIGGAIALGFADAGADVAVLARSTGALDQVAEALRPLCAFFAIEEIERGAAWLLSHDLLAPEQVMAIPGKLSMLCDRLTPHVSVLVEAFEIPEDVAVPVRRGEGCVRADEHGIRA